MMIIFLQTQTVQVAVVVELHFQQFRIRATLEIRVSLNPIAHHSKIGHAIAIG
jgi:hypothetical protein